MAATKPATKTKAKTTRKAPAKKTAAKRAVKKTTATAKRTTAKAKKAVKAETKFVDLGKAESVAKSVWFAGLGAYGMSYDEIKSNYDKVNEQSQKLFKELVSRGEKLQGDAESTIKEQKDSIEDAFSDARKSVDEFVEKIDVNGRVKEMFNRIDSLSADLKKAV